MLSLPTPVKWSASITALFVVGLAVFFLEDTYSRTQEKDREHEHRINAEERTSAVTALQLTLMQKQLDRIEAKLDTVVTRR